VAYPPTLNIENMNESSPYPETFLAHYPHSKALAEQLVMRANDAILSTVSLRPHLIWGPEDPHLLPRLIQKGRMGKLIQVGAADNLVDLTYVENAAYAHILAAENLNGNGNAAGKTYFISDEAPVNIWKWLYELFEKLDIPPVKKSISYRQAYCLGAVMEKLFLLLPGEPPMTRFVAGQLAFSHYFNISAAKKDLGYQPAVTPEEAMEKTIAYFSSASLGFKN
jgi:nucleoside-diphosphate-sugar epimerase